VNRSLPSAREGSICGLPASGGFLPLSFRWHRHQRRSVTPGEEHSDLLEEAVRRVLHELMAQEVTQRLGAAPPGRTESRTGTPSAPPHTSMHSADPCGVSRQRVAALLVRLLSFPGVACVGSRWFAELRPLLLLTMALAPTVHGRTMEGRTRARELGGPAPVDSHSYLVERVGRAPEPLPLLLTAAARCAMHSHSGGKSAD
jgi:hypothetical protein